MVEGTVGKGKDLGGVHKFKLPGAGDAGAI